MIPDKEVIENCSSQDKKLVSSTKEDCTVKAEQIKAQENVALEDSDAMSSSDSEDSQANNTTKKKSKRIKKAQQLQKKVLKSRKQKNKDHALVDAADDNFRIYASISLGQKLKFHEIFFFVCSIVTLGLFNIINKWLKNKLYQKLVFKEVKKLEKATHLICRNDDVQEYLLIQKKKIQVNESCDIDTYIFKTNFNTYFWNEQTNCFQDVYMLFQSWDLQEFLDTTKNGISESTTDHLQDTYGQNELIFQRTSFFKFLFDLISNPISVFELSFLILLFVFKYKLYFAGLLILLVVKAVKEILNFTKQEKKFKEKYVLKENVMVVRRIEQNIFKKRIVNSQQLVPGDLIEITNNLSIPADVLLTYGKCVIQKSQDHQEDNTMTKVAVEKFQTKKLSQIDQQNLLFAGTKVLYTLNSITEGCFGVVLRTGFNTKRGKLIKQKVNKNAKNKLAENDMFYFYSILTGIAISLSIITITYEHLYSHNLQNFQNEIFQKIFQIFLVLLKPTIPLALIATIDQSIKNLKNKQIITNDLKQISSLGKSNRCFIDQDILLQSKFTDCCFLISKNKEAQTYKTFDKLITNTKKIAKKIQRKPIMKRYIESFGLCNMVTKIGEDFYGPIEDIEMLKKSNFELHYDFEEKESIKRYFVMDQKFSKDFSSSYENLRFFEVNSAQRNFKSAVVKNAENQHFLYCKGDPISLQQFCSRKTIPYNFEQTMSKYSLKGYKCIALAYKEIDQNQVDYKREDLEKNLTFLGFYLKKVQTDSQNNQTIENLKETDMNVILTTEKSLYLALSTAKESQIISHSNPVLLGKTKELNKVDSLVWEKLESVKTEQENYNLEKQDEINFYQEILNTENQIVVTGKALRLLTEELSEDQINDVIKRIKVIGDLDLEQSKFAIEIFQKFLDQKTPLCYVHNGNGDISLIQNSEISVSLKETELASKSSFYTLESNLEKFYQLVMESKQSITNTHKIYQFVIFFCICQLFGLISLYFQRTSYGLVHIFFLDFFILMAFSVIQSNLQGSYKFKLKSRSIFNKKFWSFVSTMGIYGITVIFMILQLLQKTKFYQSPIQLAAKSKNLNPNKNYFYDPFVTFMILIILNICFFALANKNQIRLKNCGSFLYLVLLVSSSLIILFGNQVAEITQSQDIKMLFRIPELNGFEFLFCLFIPIILIGFVAVKILEKKIAKKWAIGFNKIKKLVQSDNDDSLSIQTSLYTESVLDEESATHKKKSKLKKIPVKHKSKKSQRCDGSTNRSLSRNQSNIEKKRRARRSRMKIKRKKRNISIDSDQIIQ